MCKDEERDVGVCSYTVAEKIIKIPHLIMEAIDITL